MSDLSVKSKLQDLRDPELNTDKADTLVDYRSLEK